LQHKNLQLGYYFEYEAEGEDLETIYQIAARMAGRPIMQNQTSSTAIPFQYLFKNLHSDEQIAAYLSQPYYQLVLGRMNDLATV
jgi:CRISPR-associated protein Cas5t